MRRVPFVLVLALAACNRAETATKLHARAQALASKALLVDGHNDLPMRIREKGHSSFAEIDVSKRLAEGHTDIPRLREGHLGAQFWSAYVPVDTIKDGTASRFAYEQIDLIHRLVDRYPTDFEFALTADDVERIRSKGKIACLIGLEGGHAIENSLETLRDFHARGVRYMTLTHTDTTDWADAATDEPRHGGLTAFGEDVVREMNRLGMLVDISHVSVETMKDALRVSKAPIIASHSSAFALCPHPRNVPDGVLRDIKLHDGLVMINFAPGFLDPDAAKIALELYPARRALAAKISDPKELDAAVDEWRKAHPLPSVPWTRVVDHIEHVAKVAGIEHVGIGSDFDGISAVPAGLEDVSMYPKITEELLRRGFGEDDVERVLGQNLLRVLRGAERVAREWKR